MHVDDVYIGDEIMFVSYCVCYDVLRRASTDEFDCWICSNHFTDDEPRPPTPDAVRLEPRSSASAQALCGRTTSVDEAGFFQ